MNYQSDDDEEDETIYDLIKNADFYRSKGNTSMADNCWENVILRSKEKKEEVKQKHQSGLLTILSMTITYHAPYNVVEMISRIHPEACRDDYPSLPLYLAIVHMDGLPEWEKVVELLMMYYPEAIKYGESNTTILHKLLEHQPSVHLVRSMVECHRLLITDEVSESQNTPLLLTKDENDQIPFHVAVEFQASDDVIGYLLSEYPNAARCSREGHDGCLPLHIAIISECTGVTLSALVRTYPEALTIPNVEYMSNEIKEGGETPLHLIFNRDIFDEKKMKNVRWNTKKMRTNLINSSLLSAEGTCKYLLSYHVRSTKRTQKANKIKELVNIPNAKGHTVLQSALECAKVFPVPESILILLRRATEGTYTPVDCLP